MSYEGLKISTYSISQEAGEFVITAQVMMDTLIPRDILKKDIFSLKGKEVRVGAFSGEHQIPEIVPESVVGEVFEVYWDEKLDAPFAKAKIFGDTEDELKLRETLLTDQKLPVEQRTYKGVSIGIVNYTKKRHFIARELTLTNSPACAPCTIAEARQYSMSVPADNSKLVEYFSSTILKDKETIISTLTDKLDKVTKEFSGATELLKTKLAEKEKEIEGYNKKVADFSGVIAGKDKEIDSLKESVRFAQVSPLVETILYALSYPKDSELYKTEKEALMKKPQADLAAELARMKHLIGLHGQVLPTTGPNPGPPAAQAFNKNGNGELIMSFEQASKLM
jgi:hypothetical protein